MHMVDLLMFSLFIYFSLKFLEIKPVNPKGDQPWDFFGRNDAKAETPVLWPPHSKSWLIGKDSDAEKNWGQEEKGTTVDEMAGSQRVRHDWVTELNWFLLPLPSWPVPGNHFTYSLLLWIWLFEIPHVSGIM